MGIGNLTLGDFANYRALFQEPLAPMEIEAIQAIDEAFFRVARCGRGLQDEGEVQCR